MSEEIQRVLVYCASSQRSDQQYRDHAYELGQLLAEKNYEVIYGGGGIGSMGALADGVLSKSGYITGIIPEFMKEMEAHHTQISETIWVDTMHERKRLMLEKSDGIIGLPGGSGTLEELMEAITLKRLGKYLNPIILINTRGSFSPLEKLFDRCIEEQFMREKHRDMWSMVDTPREAIEALHNAPPWSSNARKFAALK